MSKDYVRRIFIAYSLLVCFVVVAMSGINFYNMQTSTKESFDNANKTVLTQATRVLELNLYHIDQMSQSLSNNYSVQSFIERDYGNDRIIEYYSLQRLLSNYQITQDYIESIYLYNESKNIVLTNENIFELANFSDKAWVNRYNGITEYFDWSGVRRIAKNNVERDVITLIRRFSTNDNTSLLGAVVINVNASIFDATFSGVGTSDKKGYCISSDAEKGFLVYNNTEEYISSADTEKFKQLFEAEDSIEQVRNGGKLLRIHTAHSEYTPWAYHLIVPQDNLTKMIWDNLIYTIGSVAIMVALVLVFLYSTDKKTIRPLDTFIESIANYTEGLNPPEGKNIKSLNDVYRNIEAVHKRQQEQIEDSIPALKWHLFMEILNGNKTDFESLRTYLYNIGTDIFSGGYIVGIIEIDNHQDVFKECDVNDIFIIFELLYQNANDVFNQGTIKSLVTKMLADKLVVMASFETKNADSNILTMITCADQLKNMMKEKHSISISIAIGGFYAHLKNISLSYQEANYAFQYKFIFGNNTIISIEDIAIENSAKVESIIEQINSISNQPISELKEYLGTIFKNIKSGCCTPNTVRQISMRIILALLKKVDDESIQSIRLKYNQVDIYYELNELDNLTDIEEYINNFISVLEMEKSPMSIQNGEDQLIEVIKRYIEQNYANNDMSLNHLSEHFKLSVSHLGKRFKSATGESFVYFLIDVRINHAKRLLNETNLKIDDISNRVGYADPKSFMRIFKKHSGVTPSEYRANQELH